MLSTHARTWTSAMKAFYGTQDFLIIECGGFAPAIPKEGEAEPTPVLPDFHCGYHIYMRKK